MEPRNFDFSVRPNMERDFGAKQSVRRQWIKRQSAECQKIKICTNGNYTCLENKTTNSKKASISNLGARVSHRIGLLKGQVGIHRWSFLKSRGKTRENKEDLSCVMTPTGLLRPHIIKNPVILKSVFKFCIPSFMALQRPFILIQIGTG